jgi:hypothetical protein
MRTTTLKSILGPSESILLRIYERYPPWHLIINSLTALGGRPVVPAVSLIITTAHPTDTILDFNSFLLSLLSRLNSWSRSRWEGGRREKRERENEKREKREVEK